MTEYAAKDCKFLGQQLQSANVVGRNGTRRSLAASLIVATVAGGAFSAWAQHVDVVAGGNGPVLTVPRIIPLEELPPTIGTLKGVEPLKPDVRDYIVDRIAAQQLGKAFFWDIQVGSNGVACASCHFHAGADIRVRNQVNPGMKAGDNTFDARRGGAGISGPNKTLSASDFPFRLLEIPDNRESRAVGDTNDVFSSLGSYGGDFISSRRGHNGSTSSHQPSGSYGGVGDSTTAANGRGNNRLPRSFNESCSLTYDPAHNPFHANNLIYRRVEPRQTPTVVNAVFNYRQFWDGRANHQFNGVDPFGPRTFQLPATPDAPGNPNALRAGILETDGATSGSSLRLVHRLIDNSSLASQAVGPALSDFEMSCAKKTFADLGRKLIGLRPLALQRVAVDDSLFGASEGLVPHGGKGLETTYRALIEKAFSRKYWATTALVKIADDGQVVADRNGFSQMEHNFSLIWGLAVQEYESTLISDDAPFDRDVAGDAKAMSAEAKAGQVVFLGKGGCVGCHNGPVFSGATVTNASGPKPKLVEHMRMSDGATALYDAGFYNIGVRPPTEDPGVGATDPYGFDLSFTRQFKWKQLGKSLKVPDTFDPTPCKWIIQYWPCAQVPTWTDPVASERDTVDGAFKAPILRNVGLNPPYFHNGGQATLKDVVRFYNRGGDRRGTIGNDTSGTATPTPFGHVNRSNLSPDIGEVNSDFPERNNSLDMTEHEMDFLVQFLLSLTDDRVACHAGVFDHPELPLIMGHEDVAVPGTHLAKDITRILPAVGKAGLKAIGKPCFPNSGDLFGSLNKTDPRPLQTAFDGILEQSSNPQRRNGRDGLLTLVNGQPVSGRRTARNAPPVPDVVPPTPPVQVPVAVPAPAPKLPAPIFTPGSAATGFTSIGFIQSAAVSPTMCSNLPPRQWGGSAKVNGITIVIPCNSIVQLPAATYTWAELFEPVPDPTAPGTKMAPTALSLDRAAVPGKFSYPSTEIRIEGNVVAGQPIAGLIYVSQQSLNTGDGFILGFEHENGVILVGKDRNGNATTRLQLNDANGRFSKGQSPDKRFNVDDANPTIRAASGYPMCVPRRGPLLEDDAECPRRNRPRTGVGAGCRTLGSVVFLRLGRDMTQSAPGEYCTGFVMQNPADPAVTAVGSTLPLSTKQAPFAIGDYITYSGTLLQGDGQGPNGSDTISVHTIVAKIGIFTEPGTLPVYLAIGHFRISSYTPNPVINGVVQEEQDRVVLEAFVTDITSIVDIYLVDYDPKSGAETQRWITPGLMTGEVGDGVITGGITTQLRGLVPGRVRLQATRAVPGILTSPTRYMRVVARSLCDPLNINIPQQNGLPCVQRALTANGIYSGQYLAPVANFIFPETLIPGAPPVPRNFWDLGFLVLGEGQGTGPLTPTPW